MPNNFLDVSGKLDRIIKKTIDAPAQGISIVGGDVALKVMQTPLMAATLTNSPSTTPLKSKKGIAYFIHSVNISAAIDADDATTEISVAVVNPSGTVIIYRIAVLPSTVAAYTDSGIVDIITESGAYVYFSMSGGNPSTLPTVRVSYQELLLDEC